MTDASGKCAEARRIDARPFPSIGTLDERKSHCLPGSRKSWPIGILPPGFEEPWLKQHVHKILLVEGVPDYLAACQLIAAQDENVLPVAMLGAGQSIGEDALPYFAGRKVTIVAHPDEAGRNAGRRWATQIHEAMGNARSSNPTTRTSATSSPQEQRMKTSDSSEQTGAQYGEWEGPKPEKKRSSDVRSCAELQALGIPPREKLLGDWFFEGDLGFIFAPRGLGKTWLALAMATAIASGGKCGGRWEAPRARPVLYVDGEMPCEALCERISGLGANENLSVLNHEALFHLSGKVLNLADPVMQEVLTARMREDGVKVLFLDNLSCLFSGIKENDADAWEAVLQWFLTLRRYRIAVVLVHHSGRNKENMRGTSRREDAAFWVIRLDEIQGERREGTRFLSRFTKDRNSSSEQAALDWHFTTDSEAIVRVATKEASSIEVFRQWIEDGLTSAEDIAREMGVSKGTVSKMATKGIKEGWLTKNGREYELV